MTAPPPLFDQLDQPAARAVLADWFEEQGEGHWARWIRSTADGEARKRLLKRVVRKSGWKLRQTDHAFFDLQEPLSGPLLSTLSWEVKDPSILPDLLRCPAFARVDRVHLSSFRPRTAVARVLPGLVRARPGLTHLDLLDVPCPFEAIRDLSALTGLGMRLERPVRADLSVRQLCIRVLTADDFTSWLDVQTDALKRLEIRRVPTLQWDADALRTDVVKALLDRPFDTLGVDRSLYFAHRGVFERHSSGRIAVLPPRPVFDPMLTREEPQRWSILA